MSDDELGNEQMHDSPDAQPTHLQDPHTPRKRSRARTIFGWIFIVIAALAVLGTLANLGSGNFQGASNSGELVGVLIGAAIFIAVPLIVGLLLLRRPKA